MKADVSKLHQADTIRQNRKEKGFYREISIIDPVDGSAIVAARLYWPGRDGASNCYACVWINGNSNHGAGGGKAGGYGYHKESAAIQEALESAGVALSEDIGGRGDQAMFEALEAVAKAVTGKRKVFRHIAHA